LLGGLLFIGPGCGGGTVGSSPTGLVGKSFDGRIIDANGQGVSNATVTVLESGDTGTTDANGNFSFTATVTDGSTQTITVRSADGKTVTITDIYPGTDGNYSFTAIFDRVLKVAFEDFLFEASVEGRKCENSFYGLTLFGKSDYERQLKRTGRVGWFFDELFPVAPGTNCRIVGRATRSGIPISSLPFIIETGGCDGTERRIQSGEDRTSSDGRFVAPFRFDPKPGNCNYNVRFTGDSRLPGDVVIIVSSEYERENF